MLLGILFLLAAVSGTGVALSRTPRQQVLAMAVNGMMLALLFLVVLASIKMDRSPPGGDP